MERDREDSDFEDDVVEVEVTNEGDEVNTYIISKEEELLLNESIAGLSFPSKTFDKDDKSAGSDVLIDYNDENDMISDGEKDPIDSIKSGHDLSGFSSIIDKSFRSDNSTNDDKDAVKSDEEKQPTNGLSDYDLSV